MQRKIHKKTFLFLRGLPAAGKITVARELEKRFGWKVIWLHAIKNVIYDIVKEHDLSGLMRNIMEPITEHVLQSNNSVIFIRPATETKTVLRMKKLVSKYPQYRFDLVTLIADRNKLLTRAKNRRDPYRIDSKHRMDEYFSRSGKIEKIEGELVIDTTNISLKQTLHKICLYFGYE